MLGYVSLSLFHLHAAIPLRLNLCLWEIVFSRCDIFPPVNVPLTVFCAVLWPCYASKMATSLEASHATYAFQDRDYLDEVNEEGAKAFQDLFK